MYKLIGNNKHSLSARYIEFYARIYIHVIMTHLLMRSVRFILHHRTYTMILRTTIGDCYISCGSFCIFFGRFEGNRMLQRVYLRCQGNCLAMSPDVDDEDIRFTIYNPPSFWVINSWVFCEIVHHGATIKYIGGLITWNLLRYITDQTYTFANLMLIFFMYFRGDNVLYPILKSSISFIL